ncbi:immunoglobulin superfamily member 1-like [Chrysemys picta bellii]|uniref:immunoglobulin superfamily member 1-like n=1 Tax=Chrysemys picta bellii TaxID=8478 RepID=UPI0032B2A311
MWGSEVMGSGLGSCRRGCGLLCIAGSWLCSDHSRFGLEIAEKPSDGAERGRVHHGLPGVAAPSAVPHSACTRASGWVELGTGVLVAALRGPHCPIMASALTVLLLGCSLAGQSWVLGAGREFPKPPISVSPSRVVALAGNVTIRCEGLYPGMEFFLHKAGHPNPQVRTVPDGTVAEFPIASVSREDGGSYTCDYRSKTDQSRSSHPSDSIEIIVGEPSYPKPSIYLRPSGGVSLGGVVSVWCRGQHRGMRFVLNKERRHFPPVDTDEFEVVFPISNVSREDGGSYSCSYHSRSEPFNVSYPSDPVELVVRDPNLPRPSISLSPTGVTAPGANVTIRCQGQCQDVTFFLHKAGDLNPPRHMDPAGDGAEFRIPTVGRQHAGSYSCSYRNRSEPFISSQPSDPVQLVVAGGPVSNAASVLTCSIIAGVSAAAVGLLLLLLLLAFVCYRRTRGNALVAEGKQMDVLPQETDPGAEGLTYAELDGQVLQAKRGGPAPAPEPVLYATINMSKGLTGRAPRVQKRPPPTPMASESELGTPANGLDYGYPSDWRPDA